MLSLMILLMALVAIAADTLYYRRLKRRKFTTTRRWVFVGWVAVTDSLPVVIALGGLLLRDNSTEYMTLSMWGFWIWITTVIPRLIFYLFDLLHLPKVGAVVGLCLTGLFIWGATAGRTTIRVNRVELRSARIPAGFNGFRIVQLSDIHLGSLVCPERELGRIVDSVNALRPDLVIFSGDLVNIRYTELDARAQRLLGGIQAPVLSVTGNHDVGTYIKDTVSVSPEQSLRLLLERQQAMGWQVLQDTTIYLNRGGDSISLSGIAFNPALRKRRHDSNLPQLDLEALYGNTPAELFNITIVHLPQLWGQLVDAGRSDLTLSGHVHSMQLKMKIMGREFSPASWLYNRWSGRYTQGRHTLYINDGTGYVAYPMRIGAYPEITLFTLQSCE